MKQVLLKKRKYGFRDVFRFIADVAMHYALFYVYFLIIFGVNYLANDTFIPNIKVELIGLFYPCVIAPGVNALLHIWYSERGLPWVRMAMWAHTFFVLLVVPLATFLI